MWLMILSYDIDGFLHPINLLGQKMMRIMKWFWIAGHCSNGTIHTAYNMDSSRAHNTPSSRSLVVINVAFVYCILFLDETTKIKEKWNKWNKENKIEKNGKRHKCSKRERKTMSLWRQNKKNHTPNDSYY